MSSSERYGEWKLECKVYVGDLGYGAEKHELEDVFSRHGALRNVWIARNPPGFAFVEFEDYRDAEDACKALDGTTINGRKVRVEMSSGKSRWKYGPPTRSGWRGGFKDDWESERKRSYSPRRSNSPRRRSRSRSRSGSRYRRSRSPYRRSNSPYRRSMSPYRKSISPYRRSRSPYRRSRSPYRKSNSPYKRSMSPYRRSRSPEKPYSRRRDW